MSTATRTSGNGAGIGWNAVREATDRVVREAADRALSTAETVAYVAIGAAAVLGTTLGDAVGEAFTWVLSRDAVPQRHPDGDAAVRHTLRIVEDEFDAAQPFGGLAGATHMIVYNPATRYARASLAHEFAHVLLAVIRGGPAEEIGASPQLVAGLQSEAAHVEECATWALARAITKGSIWTGAATTYRERVLAEYGVPAWAWAPRIPPPTRALVRWLAQVEP